MRGNDLFNNIENMDNYSLSRLYLKAHDLMRNIDGLQPQEAFEELLKFLFFKQSNEDVGPALNSFENIASPENREVKKIASEIRSTFAKYVEDNNSWVKDLWKDKKFHLSDSVLVKLYFLFCSINICNISFDSRSAALKEFLSADIRRGLGIYLTPDDVVRMMVEFVSPTHKDIVYDPACGSGTFLIETLKYRQRSKKIRNNFVWGTDKNPRMLIIAELNMGHLRDVTFYRRVTDALFPILDENEQWPTFNKYDIIFTNPPFGVNLDNSSFDLRCFDTCISKEGYLTSYQQSEILFIEQCLKYIKPGGILAIVLPKSVITNSTYETARKALDSKGYIYAAVALPPETFATTGTQASTVVLFIKKYLSNENALDEIRIVLANVTNIGYDSTGRPKHGNQLPLLAGDLKTSFESLKDTGICRNARPIKKCETFSEVGNLFAGKTRNTDTIRLKDVVELVINGRTPARQNYTHDGLFVVKVGNLTGNGINWSARERNYVSEEEKAKREKCSRLMLKTGDILLTAAAHSPVYIAKKIDIIDHIPEWIGGVASFVGEVMLIRPRIEVIDPYVLLAFLRMPATSQRLQMLIRGQTAHLYPSDVMDLSLPTGLFAPNEKILAAASIIRQESEANMKLNEYAYKQDLLLAGIDYHHL